MKKNNKSLIFLSLSSSIDSSQYSIDEKRNVKQPPLLKNIINTITAFYSGIEHTIKLS